MINPNIIFNMGRDRVKPKPVARLFPPLREMDANDIYKNFEDWSGVDDEERFLGVGDAVEAMQKQNLGTFEERNRKTKELATERASAVENATQAQAPAPEFEIGDLVECLPDFLQYSYGHFAIGFVGKIASFSSCGWWDEQTRAKIPCVNFGASDEVRRWPIRAIRHAETEPRKEEGWYLPGDCKETWRKKNSFDARDVVYVGCDKLWYSGWTGTALGDGFPSWIALKRAMKAGAK